MRSSGACRPRAAAVGVVVLALGVLAGPALAQPAEREQWLERLSSALREPQPDQAFERWAADWRRAREGAGAGAGHGLAGNLRGVGSADAAPSSAASPLGDRFWAELGKDAGDRVLAAFDEASATWAADPTDENLERLEALGRVVERVRVDAVNELAGVPVHDAAGELLGWDRDGDGVADLVDSDGDGTPDRYVGGTNPTAYGDAFGGVTRPGMFVSSVVGRGAGTGAAAEPTGGTAATRGTTGRSGTSTRTPTRTSTRTSTRTVERGVADLLPSLARFQELGATALHAATSLERELSRRDAGGDLAGRALEELEAGVDEALETARRVADEALRAPEDARVEVVAGFGEGLQRWVEAEERTVGALQAAARSRSPAARRATEGLRRVLHRYYELCVCFHDVGVELGVLSPEARRPVPPDLDALTAGAGDDARDDGREGSEDEPKGGGGVGTGFAVADGHHIVTNAHVVRGARLVQVQSAAGAQPGEVLAVDEALDLALVRVRTPIERTLTFGPGARDPGMVVFACGFGALNERDTARHLLTTRGALSAADGETVLFDAHVNPGNSGGPLVDARGFVVGVVKAKTMGDRSRGFDSLSIAVDGVAADRWLSKHGVEVARRPGPALGDRLPFAQVSPAVVRIVIQR